MKTATSTAAAVCREYERVRIIVAMSTHMADPQHNDDVSQVVQSVSRGISIALL